MTESPTNETTVTESPGGSSGSCLSDKIFYDHGEVTAYGSWPMLGGNCGFSDLPSEAARKYFVAISSQDAEGWRDGIYCGACVRLQYTDGKVGPSLRNTTDWLFTGADRIHS